jgi:hypothetical protein
VGRALGADVVRLAVMVMAVAAAAVVDVDKEERQAEGKEETSMGVGMAGGTHGVVLGRTKTKRDRRITIGNEDTTKRWPKREGQVVDEVINIFVVRTVAQVY